MKSYFLANLATYQCGRQGKCCHGWSIHFSRGVIDRIAGNIDLFPEITEQADTYYTVENPSLPNYYARVLFPNGICPFFDQTQKECRVFTRLGFEHGNPICQSYPFTRIQFSDRVHYISSLSCTSEARKLMSHPSLAIRSEPEAENRKSWVTLDYSHKNEVTFSHDRSLTLDQYFLLERVINHAGNQPIVTFPDMLSLLISLQLMIEDQIFGDPFIFNEMPFNQAPTDTSTLPPWIDFFIHRKINLYHYKPFEDDAIPFLTWLKTLTFPITLSTQESNYAKRVLMMKHFSHISFFNFSILPVWHQIVWLCVCLILKKRYLESTFTLPSEEALYSATQWVEKNFYHDKAVFELWGKGKRGSKDLQDFPLPLWRNCFCHDSNFSVRDTLSRMFDPIERCE